MLAHCGDTTDLAYLEELAASGALLGMDRFGLDVLLPFEDRVSTVVAMCERGHADKMILSQDAMCFTDWFPPGLREQMAPNWHFLHVVQDVVPALLAPRRDARTRSTSCCAATRARSSSARDG